MLILLGLRFGDESGFDYSFGNFTRQPDRYADSLHQKAIELPSQDEELPLHSRQKNKPPVAEPEKAKEDEIQFQLAVDKNFRKEQLIEGIKVPPSHTFTQKFEDLTKDQRKVLADMYFDTNQGIPRSVNLCLPLINPQKPNQLLLVSNRTWVASFGNNILDESNSLVYYCSYGTENTSRSNYFL